MEGALAKPVAPRSRLDGRAKGEDITADLALDL